MMRIIGVLGRSPNKIDMSGLDTHTVIKVNKEIRVRKIAVLHPSATDVHPNLFFQRYIAKIVVDTLWALGAPISGLAPD